MSKPRIIRCECIDIESLSDIKLALVTARDTYQDIAMRLKSPELNAEAKKMNELLDEFSKIKPCPENDMRKERKI